MACYTGGCQQPVCYPPNSVIQSIYAHDTLNKPKFQGTLVFIFVKNSISNILHARGASFDYTVRLKDFWSFGPALRSISL